MGQILVPASAEEISYLNELKAPHGRVLTEAKAVDHEYRRFDRNFDVSIFWGCPDCRHLIRTCKFHGKNKGQLLHPVGPEGGGCAVHPASPVHHGVAFPLRSYFIPRLIKLAELFETASVSVYSHVPCGMARHSKLTVAQQIELTLVGRAMLEYELQRKGYMFEIVPYLHVYWGENKQGGPEQDNTYLISQQAWLEDREKYHGDITALPEECQLICQAAA